MDGIIISRLPYNRGIIVSISEIKDKRQAQGIVGKKAFLRDMKGGKYEGVVKEKHGTSGNVIIKFNIELPLRMLGTAVKII
jgi:ribosomal protein L35AE/L33A